MKKLIALLLFLFIACSAHAKRKNKEKYYQEIWCNSKGGISEYVLPDRTRVDCLLPDYAVEFDFANKWAEAIGQALHYSRMTNRKPGIVIILEKESSNRYINILENVIRHFNLTIQLWVVVP